MIIIKIIFWKSAFLIIYSYIFYPLILWIAAKFYKQEDAPVPSVLPKVSIVIAAYNEEKVIKSRIENCLALDYPLGNLDIMIVSDGSDDKTNSIVQNFETRGVRLFGFKERRGKVNVLNETIPRSKHDIIVLSDANTMFARDAIKKLVRHFAHPKVGCVCGALQFINAEGSRTGDLEGFYWKYESMLKKMEGARGALLGANGAIFAIRKNLFEPCPPDTIVEDFVLPMRILQKGFRVMYDPWANATEESTKHIIQEKQRRVRIGAGDYQALCLLWPMLNPFRGFPAFAFWSHKVLRWLAPFFLIGAFLTNLILVHETPYQIFFLLQCIFYGCAIIGQALSWSGIKIKFFNLCYYFVSMNLALLLGFIKFVTNTQKVTWKRTER